MITDDDVVALRPLLRYLVRRRLGRSDEDALQVAFLAAVQARNSFDPTKGRTYPTWAAYKADKAILDYAIVGYRRGTVPIGDDIVRHADSELHIEDDAIDSAGLEKLVQVVNDMIARQSPDRQRRLRLIASGVAKQDAADATGVTGGLVSYEMRKLRTDPALRTVCA